MVDKLSRRTLFKAAGVAGAAAAVPRSFGVEPAGAQDAPSPSQPSAAPQETAAGTGATHQDVLFFFTPEEARFVEAAVERLIPADDAWPGAAWAGVTTFIDRQLAAAYGAGERMYLEGPWELGSPGQGYQLPFTPGQLYRIGIQEIRAWLGERDGGAELWDLDEAEQIEVLRMLESGEVPLPSMPSPVFFETLLANTIEGWFADPAYGGNRDMVSWRMIGFPGAYAQYVDLVADYNSPYERPPMSMAQSARTPHEHGNEH